MPSRQYQKEQLRLDIISSHKQKPTNLSPITGPCTHCLHLPAASGTPPLVPASVLPAPFRPRRPDPSLLHLTVAVASVAAATPLQEVLPVWTLWQALPTPARRLSPKPRSCSLAASPSMSTGRRSRRQPHAAG